MFDNALGKEGVGLSDFALIQPEDLADRITADSALVFERSHKSFQRSDERCAERRLLALLKDLAHGVVDCLSVDKLIG